MEVRKIQITGGSSYMITLPKDWVESMGMGKNDSVSLNVQPDGTLCISSGTSDKRFSSEKTIVIDSNIDDEFLYRQLVGTYIAGHGTIILECPEGIPSAKARVASSFAQNAIGLEIMEENDTTIVIKDLMDPGGIIPSKSVDRMRVLVRNMIRDILDCFASGNNQSLGNMVDKDMEVDRLDWLVFRQVNMYQNNMALTKNTGIDLFEVSHCAYISRTIERIGDHVVLMSASLMNVSNVELFGFDVVEMIGKVYNFFSDSVSTWSARDMSRANECIVHGEKLVSALVKGSPLIPSELEDEYIFVERVVGNMKRIVEYSMDIAEIAINGAMK